MEKLKQAEIMLCKRISYRIPQWTHSNGQGGNWNALWNCKRKFWRRNTDTTHPVCSPPSPNPGSYWGLLNWGGVKFPNWERANRVLDFFLYHCAKRLTAPSLQPHLLATQRDQTSRGTILPKPVPGVSASICSCWHPVWFSSKLPYEILVNSWVMWLLTWV